MPTVPSTTVTSNYTASYAGDRFSTYYSGELISVTGNTVSVTRPIYYPGYTMSVSGVTYSTSLGMSQPCKNNTSIDTQTYLNISTFSMTGVTPTPASNSTSFAPFFTHSSGSITTHTTKMITKHQTPGKNPSSIIPIISALHCS